MKKVFYDLPSTQFNNERGMTEKRQILKVLVGSQAHGLASPESDFDYRGIFIVPTTSVLGLGNGKIKNTSWIEGQDDDTSWELGHFLDMASHCNPTILETFLAPVEEATEDGEAIRALFPYVWNAKRVRDAFIGYGLNQRKKFLDNKDNRKNKYATAYLRTLYQAWELLTTGTFTVRVADSEVGNSLKRFKSGSYDIGEVINRCMFWENKVREAAERCDKETDFDQINAVLLKLRYKHWV